MGTVVLRPVRMRRALGPTRRQRSAGCRFVPLLPFGLSPAVSAAVALPRSLLPDVVFSPTVAESWVLEIAAALRHCRYAKRSGRFGTRIRILLYTLQKGAALVLCLAGREAGSGAKPSRSRPSQAGP